MTAFKPHSLTRAGALLAALALAGAADAATIYGGGSALIAPSHRQAANCYGADVTQLPSRTGANTSATTIPFADFSGCASPYVSPGADTVQYISTDSGVGIAGLFSHDPLRYGDVDGVSSGIQLTWTSGVQYGLSDIPLYDADLVIYNYAGTIQGVTLSPTPTSGQYPSARPLYGALVQFPIALTPIALAYDPIYKKVNNAGTITSYSLKVDPSFARSNGGLRLDATTYCKIVNGQVTNWNDPAITTLNNNTSLKDPADPDVFDVPIELVGQRDSSGATQIASRHFYAACGDSANPNNKFFNVNGSSTLPATAQGNPVGGAPVPGKFTLANGANGVAAYASFSDAPAVGKTIVRGRLAYVGASFTLPAAAANGLPYTLYTASLKNAAGSYQAPTSSAATNAFASNRPPQTRTPGVTGAYDTTQTAWGVRTNPADWVRVFGGLANPTPATAYPIVGTVNFVGYTCYASAAVANTIRTPTDGSTPGYLNYWLDGSTVVNGAFGILNSAGLAPLPPAWQNAIKNTFLAPDASTSPLNLFIDVAGAGATNSTCSAAGVTGA
jgi:ABC-type phosphate transport system substrate-binding protein